MAASLRVFNVLKRCQPIFKSASCSRTINLRNHSKGKSLLQFVQMRLELFQPFTSLHPTVTLNQHIRLLSTVQTEENYHSIIKDNEKPTGQLDKHEFQAETRMLLDIVARSLYSEKEVSETAQR